MSKMSENKKRAFKQNGKTIYEWEQNLNEVLMYIKPPAGKFIFFIILKVLRLE